jgi:hypothetical protein
MPSSAASRRNLSASPFKVRSAPLVEEFAVGDRVSHDTHGLGRVVTVENQAALIVDFGPGPLRLTTPFEKLFKL